MIIDANLHGIPRLERPDPTARGSNGWVGNLLLLICLPGIASAQVSLPVRPPNRLPTRLDVSLGTTGIRARLHAGRYAPSLVSATGEDGKAWRNQGEETLPKTVELEGQSRPVHWTLRPAMDILGASIVDFVYESSAPRMRLHWLWQARAKDGAIEHTIRIENLSGRELWLPMLDSLRLNWLLDRQIANATPLEQFYVEKGADTPSAEGTHMDAVTESYAWIGRSSPYARPIAGEPREIIPIEFVYAPTGSRDGWYAGIEFSGRTRIALHRQQSHLRSVLGLNPEPGPYRTRLPAHGSFQTPTAFLGAFKGGLEEGSNQLKRWVRAVLNNPKTWQDAQYPLTVSNSWGSGTQVDETLALRMMNDAKVLGLEMFHLDAGWFRGVGDWYPDAKKFPHGLAFLADEAHKRGLRFGLWVDWSQAGVSPHAGALNVHNPSVHDWLLNDLPAGWMPEEFKGETIDIGVPAAREYASKEVERIVKDYHLDMLEHDGYLVAEGCTREDHPHAPPVRSTERIEHDSGFDFVTASNATDVSYHAVHAYYSIYEQLRREHPGVLFEICNDGGRMVDFGSAAHGDYFSITDTYDPLSNRRAFYDASYALPSAMLESYIEKWPTPAIAQFRYMLRSGMMGWMTLMLDTTAWGPEQREAARSAIALYKERLRPLIRDARLYHVSDRPDGVHWDGMEYWDPARCQGLLYAFRGSDPQSPEHSFVLEGLNRQKLYRLHFEDGSSPDRTLPGSELLTAGLALRLGEPFSSELVFFSEVVTQD